jgi:hypothetical protein
MSKFVIRTIQTTVRVYYVEVNDVEWACDGIVMNELEEFSAECFSEDIIHVASVDEFPSQPLVNVNAATNTFNYTTEEWDKEVHWELATKGESV